MILGESLGLRAGDTCIELTLGRFLLFLGRSCGVFLELELVVGASCGLWVTELGLGWPDAGDGSG